MLNKIKWLILPVLMIVSFVLITKPTSAALIPNADFPPNQANNTWSQPVGTYSGQYMIYADYTTQTDSKVMAISIPEGDLLYFTIVYNDDQMNAYTINSNDMSKFNNVLINRLGHSKSVYVAQLEVVPVSYRINVYTIFNFTTGGGNTGTWRTNILNDFYLSHARLWSSLTSLSDVIYDNAYNQGYSEGYGEGWDSGYFLGRNEGYDEGATDAVNQEVKSLFEYVLNWIGSIFNLEILPDIKIGYLIMIPITFGMIKGFLSIIK